MGRTGGWGEVEGVGKASDMADARSKKVIAAGSERVWACEELRGVERVGEGGEWENLEGFS